MSFYRPRSRLDALVRNSFKVLAADVILLAAGFWVLQDLQWRTGFASSLHDACSPICRYSPSFSYSFLTRFFTMTGNGVSLTSPPTLDWVQLIVCLLVIVNAWFIYDALNARRLGADKGAASHNNL